VKLAAEKGAQEGVCQGLDQCTSMQGMQHTTSQQHSSGSMTPKSASQMMAKPVFSHLVIASPTFFMNIITSDWLNFPSESAPIVSCMLPYTWGSARETRSPS
jgi:hypothetical protein